MIKTTIDKDFFKKWKHRDVVMHCPKEEYAEEFCRLMDENGLTWGDGEERYLNNEYWYLHKSISCYQFNDGKLGNIYWCRAEGYIILEFEDFIIPEEEPTPELTPELLPTPADIMKEAINSICLSVDDFIIDSIKEDFHLDLRKTKDYLTFQNNFKVMKVNFGLCSIKYEIYCKLTDKLLTTYKIKLEKDNGNV